MSGTGERVRRLERIERVGADGAMLVANDTMMTLPYSLVIEATEDADFFGFYSPDLEGFTGVAHSIEDCLYQARWGMADHVQTLREQSKCGSISRCERGGMSGPQRDAQEAVAGRGVGPGDAGAKDVDGGFAGGGGAAGRGGRRGGCAGPAGRVRPSVRVSEPGPRGVCRERRVWCGALGTGLEKWL